MVANVSFNPQLTTNAAGTFNKQSEGYIVGTALNDPAVRNELAGGVLSTNETIPMWGGVGIFEDIPAQASPGDSLGPLVGRAADNAHLTGFAVFDQNNASINFPQSPVPVSNSGMLVNFYRFGSGARLALEIDPALVTLEGGLITQQVSWDFANQKVIAFDGGVGALNVRVLQVALGGSMTVVWDNVNKFATWNRSGNVAICLI